MSNDKKLPEEISIITGIFVQNEKGEILFGRMPKWENKWAIFGGHVDPNETLRAGAKRELLEETGLDAPEAELEYVGYVESVNPPDYHKPKHFIGFEFRYKVEGRPEVMTNDEFSETAWMTVDEMRKESDLNTLMVSALDRIENADNCNSCTELKSGWQRATADYQNLKKEMGDKQQEWIAYSKQQVIEDFLPVYDNFKKAFSAPGIEENGWTKGIEYIMKQYGDVLNQAGIEVIETVGKAFDPGLHESVGEEESNQTPGTIIREVDAGYKMGEKIVKVAKVIIAA